MKQTRINNNIHIDILNDPMRSYSSYTDIARAWQERLTLMTYQQVKTIESWFNFQHGTSLDDIHREKTPTIRAAAFVLQLLQLKLINLLIGSIIIRRIIRWSIWLAIWIIVSYCCFRIIITTNFIIIWLHPWPWCTWLCNFFIVVSCHPWSWVYSYYNFCMVKEFICTSKRHCWNRLVFSILLMPFLE